MTQETERFRRVDDQNVRDMLSQIGMNIWAISGGRVTRRDTGITLPCGAGYAVLVDLDPRDTYVVRRVFRRAGTEHEHGERTDVYCTELAEVAYYASCFRSYDDAEWVTKA